MLLWARPEIAKLDCNECFKFLYDIETGKPEQWRGKPARRPRSVPPPCKKCPKQGPDKHATLTLANMECVQHYLECKAIGQFPDDPLVRRHAAILQMVEREVAKYDRQQELTLTTLQQTAAHLSAMTKALPQKG